MLRKVLASIVLAFGLIAAPQAAAPITSPWDGSMASFDKRQCGEPLAVFRWIMGEFHERPVFTSDTGKVAVFYNPKTKTFSIVKIVELTTPDKVKHEKACLFEDGHTRDFSLASFAEFKS